MSSQSLNPPISDGSNQGGSLHDDNFDWSNYITLSPVPEFYTEEAQLGTSGGNTEWSPSYHEELSLAPIPPQPGSPGSTDSHASTRTSEFAARRSWLKREISNLLSADRNTSGEYDIEDDDELNAAFGELIEEFINKVYEFVQEHRTNKV